MRRLRTFLLLPSTERNLLISAALWLGLVRLGLWLLPFQSIRRLLKHYRQPSGRWSKAGPISPEQIAWDVTVAAHYIPNTCLSRALATHALLERAGFSAYLRIGLAKKRSGQLEGHAWVESQGKIVIGALEDLSRYVPLPPL
jgi:Transglutaminase-like superfamily